MPVGLRPTVCRASRAKSASPPIDRVVCGKTELPARGQGLARRNHETPLIPWNGGHSARAECLG